MNPSATGPFPGYHQVGYVTTDFDRALAQFGETHNIRRFYEMRDAHYETGPGREAVCHVGLAYSGATEFEVIAPLSGDVQLYRDFLPASGFAIRFHHLSRMFPDDAAFDAQVEQHQRAGRALPILGGMGNVGRYFYADYRRELGHYLEGIVFGPDGKELLEAIPRF